jgi:hypothetical protein
MKDDNTFDPQAILLEMDLEAEANRLRLDELVRTGAVTIMPFGQYRGKRIDMIPDDYLIWAVKSMKQMTPDLRRSIKRHLIDR